MLRDTLTTLHIVWEVGVSEESAYRLDPPHLHSLRSLTRLTDLCLDLGSDGWSAEELRQLAAEPTTLMTQLRKFDLSATTIHDDHAEVLGQLTSLIELEPFWFGVMDASFLAQLTQLEVARSTARMRSTSTCSSLHSRTAVE